MIMPCLKVGMPLRCCGTIVAVERHFVENKWLVMTGKDLNYTKDMVTISYHTYLKKSSVNSNELTDKGGCEGGFL